jgi:3-hydroxyacyl-CoA dehydrogenase
MQAHTNSPVSTRREGRVAVVVIDAPPVNALSRAVRQGLRDAIREMDADDSIESIVLAGAQTRFIAGADLREMDLPPDEPFLPEVVEAVAALRQPVVAAIAGPALGGGLEIALACDLRLATPDASAGLPETRLGVLPGAGGTQRLPRLVGIARAIELTGEARILKAAEARELGLFDAIVEGDVVAAAIAAAPSVAKRRLSDFAPPKADVAAEQAAAAAAIKRGRGTPSVSEAVAIVRATATDSFQAGLQRERAAFLRARESPEARALRYLFLAAREAAKVPGLENAEPRTVRRVAVIGAGTMGSGIAVSLADAGIAVDLVEQSADAAKSGAERVNGIYDWQIKSGRLTEAVADERRSRINATHDWSITSEADLVIEAAFEDITVKAEIFQHLDQLARPGTVLATNTSYLDVNAIAATTGRPQDVLGQHFFSPANVMPLLEVVAADRTSPDVLATGLALGRRIGKLPIVARVCDGFIGNRIFAVYRRHAEYLLEDGASPQEIDAALEAYGFAMGPFAVADMSGLDIAWAMRKRRAATRHRNERYVSIPDRLCEAGRLGRKAGRGWFNYASGKAEPDPEVEAVIAQERDAKSVLPREFTADEIQRRILTVMANEGAKILSEGVSLRPSDLDLVFVNGYGFPRLKGGPMFAADQRGLAEVLDEVKAAAAVGGVGSEPASLLVELARQGSTFRDWQAMTRRERS